MVELRELARSSTNSIIPQGEKVKMNLTDIIAKESPKPPRIFIYGVEGIGKSTFASQAPSPIFIQTEDGLGAIQVPRFPLAKKYKDVVDAITVLATESHDYQTVVVDSADWLEALIRADVDETGRRSPQAVAFGKGVLMAASMMKEILTGLNYLRDSKNMTVIVTGHSQIKSFNSPEVESFDRYMPKLQDRTSALIREWADIVGFANWQISTKHSGQGFNETTRGISSGDRYLYLQEKPAYLAKNRYSMPDRIPFSWADFSTALSNLINQ